MLPKMSYSRVATWHQCPYKYRLRYIDGLVPFPSQDPYNALYLGNAIHKAIEAGPEAGIAAYNANFFIATNVTEAMSLQVSHWAEHIWGVIPEGGQHEVELSYVLPNGCLFTGFIDYIVGDTIYDFKVTNNGGVYLQDIEKRKQLLLYLKIWNETHPDSPVRHIAYVFIPKTMLRPRRNETDEQYLARMRDKVSTLRATVAQVDWDETELNRVYSQFIKDTSALREIHLEPTGKCYEREFVPNCERFCPYYDVCTTGADDNIMNPEILDSCEKRIVFGEV